MTQVYVSDNSYSLFSTIHTRRFRQTGFACSGNRGRYINIQEVIPSGSRTMSPYLNVATPEPLVVVKNRPRRRGQLTPEPRIRRGHDGLSTGGAKGTRTPDPHTASVVRYQLRHSPEKLCSSKLHHCQLSFKVAAQAAST